MTSQELQAELDSKCVALEQLAALLKGKEAQLEEYTAKVM